MFKPSSILKSWGYFAVFGLFVVLPLSLVTVKVVRVGYDLSNLLPVESHRVTLTMSCSGHGDSLWVRTFLPQADARVTLLREGQNSDLPGFAERIVEDNRVNEWYDHDAQGEREIHVSYTTYATATQYDIDPRISVPGPPLSRSSPLLQSTPKVQVEDPEIATLAGRLAPTGTSLVDGLRGIHGFCQKLGYVSFKGETDALTALRLGEASCNGRSRLFVALARHQGIPARLVGGLLLEPGVKRTSHQWVEVKMGSHWVPFCPTNDHFATLPASYLPLYYGDHALFAHSRDINFQYRFRIEREFAVRPELVSRAGSDPLNLLSFWSAFERAGIPASLLKAILMIPLGALVIVILRNVVGLETFGIFLPVLIAIASRDTGLLWGITAFVVLIGLVFLVRTALSRLHLLHMPQMAILLTFVIIFMLGFAVIGAQSGDRGLAHVSLFPVAILAITTERLALTIEEAGPGRALRLTLMSALAIAACYIVMNALTFQILFLSFPELLLVVVFLDIWLGRWMGLRVLEYWRFRKLIPEARGS